MLLSSDNEWRVLVAHSLSAMILKRLLPVIGTLTLALSAQTFAAPVPAFSVGDITFREDDLPTGSLRVGEETYSVDPTQRQALDSSASESVLLKEWPAGKVLSRFAALHTYHPGQGIEEWRQATGLAHRKLQPPPDWPTVFRYEIEYLDGKTVEIPVRFGEAIEQWYRVQTVAPMLWARNAWTQPLDPISGEKRALYSMAFPNPRPSVPVKALRALPAAATHKSYGTALILAVSTGDDPARGKLYIVDRKPIGDDSQAGSYDAPFGSLQHAMDLAVPGDTILVRGGYYALDTAISKRFDGQSDNWLTLSAFPGETPVLDAYGIHLDYRKSPYGDQNHEPRRQTGTGVVSVWGDPDYFRVQGLHIQNSRQAAISVYGLSDPDSNKPETSSFAVTDHVDILFNDTYQSFSMGIISHQTNRLRVIGNRVIRPHSLEMATDPQTGQQVSHDHQPQEAIDLSRNRYFEVAFNTVTGGGKEGIDCISVEDGRIHHNYVESCLNGIYIDSWSIPIRRLDIHRNFINNAYYGVPLATEGSNDLLDFDIHHNIIVNSKSIGIAVTEATYKARAAAVQGHRVFNNTIYRAGGHALSIGWQSAGIEVSGFPDNENFRAIEVIRNIVAYAQGVPLSSVYSQRLAAHDIRFDRNLIWPSLEDTTPEHLRLEEEGWLATNAIEGTHTIVEDPLFTDPKRGDFRISAQSPARSSKDEAPQIGALPYGAAWIPGLDFAGAPTAFYHGETIWQSVSIPRERFTLHRNSLQRPSWFQRNRYGADFRNLPDGEQSFGGATFFIERDDQLAGPNVLALAGIQNESDAPSIDGLLIGRQADQLAFLHNAHVSDRAAIGHGGTLFHYRVHYADGSSLDIPIRLGIEIEDWLNTELTAVSDARIGWSQYVTKRHGEHAYLHLYSYRWTNPHPTLRIESIDILRACEPLDATPAVFAISTGISS